MEYRVISESDEKAIEIEINILAKEGFEVSFASANDYGLYIIMQRNRLE